VRPEGLFVEASRLLCQAFRFRQHLLSKKLTSCSFAAAALRWPLRRGRESMSPTASFVKGCMNFFHGSVHSFMLGPRPKARNPCAA
jgi:hypothetical protein